MAKKIVALVLALVMTLSLCSVTAFAAVTGTTVTFGKAPATYAPGETITFNVSGSRTESATIKWQLCVSTTKISGTNSFEVASYSKGDFKKDITLDTAKNVGLNYQATYVDTNGNLKPGTYTVRVVDSAGSTVYATADFTVKEAQNITVKLYNNYPVGDTGDFTSKSVPEGTAYGNTTALPAPTAPAGYEFLAWSKTADGELLDAAATISTNTDLYAQWKPEGADRKVVFNSNGGSTISGNWYVKSGAAFGKLPTPTKAGYTFDAWYTNSGTTKVTSETIVPSGTDQVWLTAKWICENHTWGYTVDTADHVTVTAKCSNNDAQGTAVLTAVPGGVPTLVGNKNWTKYNIPAPQAVYYQMTSESPKTWTVIDSAPTTSGNYCVAYVIKTPCEYVNNTTFALDSGNDWDTWYTVHSDCDHFAYLRFDIIAPTYTVTFDEKGGNLPVSDTTKYYFGDKVTEPTSTNRGKGKLLFDAWYYDANNNGEIDETETEWNFSTDTVTTNTNLIAKYYAKVTFDKNGAAGTTPTDLTVYEGSKVKQPNNTDLGLAKTGYNFEGWFYKTSTGKYAEWNFDTAIASNTDLTNGVLTLVAGWTQVKPEATTTDFTPAVAGDVKANFTVSGGYEQLLTDAEKQAIKDEGKSYKLILTVDEPDKTNAEVNGELGALKGHRGKNETLAFQADISLTKEEYNVLGALATETDVKEANAPITVTINVPDDVWETLINDVPSGYRRTIYVNRAHTPEGSSTPVVTSLGAATVNMTDKTLSFTTDQFSVYEITYVDVKVNHPHAHYVVNSVKTGDSGVLLYGVLAVSSLMGMGYTVKRRKDEM